ncbi:MAG: dTDP-4-dehydrorhamnose 3,5-epimerase [Flavisolibacter sp.]
MIFTPNILEGSYVIDLEPYSDERGWFARFFCKDEFRQIGHNKEWVQLNHSTTYEKGALRGMHFQIAPYKEVKMVRCIAGAVYDVVVDLRKDSATFLGWFGTELSAENKKMIYIPEGFAHGFQCLSNICELIYFHTEYYKPDSEAGVRFDDPLLNIEWPLQVTTISERDKSHPYLSESFKGI